MSADTSAGDVGTSWKLWALTDKANAEAALAASLTDDWDPELVVSANEADPQTPDIWRFEAWYPRRPTKALRQSIAGLFAGEAPDLKVEKVASEDWVTLSQQGLEPVRAGPFVVRTPDHAAPDAVGLIDLVIPASRAFGTGQHETTAGCLSMIDRLRRHGARPRRIADVGTGTGVLALAAHKVFPSARIVASDIDPVCAEIISENAATNKAALGARAGAIHYVTATGLAHPAIEAGAPYDLILANILAGPLIRLAPEIAHTLAPRGYVVLAGLLTKQEMAVMRAYNREGLRLRHRIVDGDWTILLMRKGFR